MQQAPITIDDLTKFGVELEARLSNSLEAKLSVSLETKLSASLESKLSASLTSKLGDSMDRKMGVYFELFEAKFNSLLEVILSMQQQLSQKPDREEFLELKQDVQIIKLAVGATNQIVNNHELRPCRLESRTV